VGRPRACSRCCSATRRAAAPAPTPRAASCGCPSRTARSGTATASPRPTRCYEDTDWPQILELYDALLRAWPSPVVALNRAVALAEVEGPGAALTAVEALEGLEGYRYLHATRADFLRRLGRHAEAAEAYRTAQALTGNTVERAFLADVDS
jgi:RNA polymerase sigma-70 factor (ECF subfamily)